MGKLLTDQIFAIVIPFVALLLVSKIVDIAVYRMALHREMLMGTPKREARAKVRGSGYLAAISVLLPGFCYIIFTML